MDILWYVGAFVLILSPIIFIHELGHFLAARWFDIEVEEFGIGFPPRAVTLFERNGTKYTLNWIPLGGFVRPAGEDDPTVKGGLSSASKTARFTVLVMGAVFNFIFAFFVLWGALMYGYHEEFLTRIDGFTANNVAEAAGFERGDIFYAVEGQEIGVDQPLLLELINENAGNEIEVTVERDGELVELQVVPMASSDDPVRGLLGVNLGSVPFGSRTQLGPVEAAARAIQMEYEVVALTLSAPAQLIRGTMSPADARPISPVGISQIAGNFLRDAFNAGGWFNVFYFTGLISVALGFTNLLPLPALDGGRILFVIVEALRGRRISPEREGFVHVVGMMLLLGLMALLIVNDVVNPIFQ